ncbi:MAG: hypothetical protein FJ396_00210 [Verrucomicrobia bacterium]|nr:hypothetical protein [Verrucomicrobiota bacterium]
MSSTKTWAWWRGDVDWSTPAGRLLRTFFDGLPTDRRFHFILFCSAPLQLTLNRSWTSADVDLFSDDDEDHHQLIRSLGLGKGQADLYLELGYRLSFRTTPWMAERAKVVSLGHVTVTIPHPLDILIAKLARLDAKDLLAFRRVIDLTGHPTQAELLHELRNAVDLFRPAFDDESPNLYPSNSVRLWRELWQASLDVGRDIVAPALARRRAGYGDPPPDYQRSLAG